jgi:lysophospholipase L1-like esterase
MSLRTKMHLRSSELWRPVAAGIVFLLVGCTGPTTDSAESRTPDALIPARVSTQVVTRAPGQSGLASFFYDLQRLQAGRLDHVRILQLGDSHTAGDVFSGYLRSRFQERFGDAGRGMMPPGYTYRGLRQTEVKVTQSGGWVIHDSLKASDPGPFGISGFLATSTYAGARMTVSPVAPGGFDIARVNYLHSTSGGPLEVLLDGRFAKVVPTAGPADTPGSLDLSTPPGTQTLEIIADTPGIRITSWGVESFHPGVLFDSFGVSGATVDIFNHWNPLLVQWDLKQLRPSLIIVAYGTNEAFELGFDAATYKQIFAQVLRSLKRMAPEASILVVGPPGGQRSISNQKRSPSTGSTGPWETPESVTEIRYIQHDTAVAFGDAYWDWASVLGGTRGFNRWVYSDPPLVRSDHIHFTVLGYEISAKALFNFLMDGYATAEGQARPKTADGTQPSSGSPEVTN